MAQKAASGFDLGLRASGGAAPPAITDRSATRERSLNQTLYIGLELIQRDRT